MDKKLLDFFETKDRFAKLLGFEIISFSKGYAKIQTHIKDEHLNGADVVHGGFLFSLADFAFAVAANSQNNLSLAINANIMFHVAKADGVLYATAREIKDGYKLASYEVRITDEEDNCIATFVGSVYRKGKNLV